MSNVTLFHTGFQEIRHPDIHIGRSNADYVWLPVEWENRKPVLRWRGAVPSFYIFPSGIARFSFFSKKACFSCAYSSSVQTSLHFGSKDSVTAKHSRIRSQGYRLHAEQVGMLFSAQHFTTR